MSAIHISKDGDMVEEGRKAIYDANEGLANRGLVLEADIEIVIPDWTAPASEVPTGGIAS
jgi:phage tail protein X